MAELGGMLASAVLQVVAGKIGSAIGDQITLCCSFNDDLQEMKDMLESIKAVLEEAERRSIQDAAVRLWLKRLKKAMFDISDMIDEFEADTEPPARKLAARIPCFTIVPKTCMAYKMKKMREKLEKITKQHEDFSFTGGSSSNMQQAIGIRETSSNVEEAKIVGRAENKQKILASLFGSITQDITILPIYGIGGIGKTTLAQLVFNDTQFKDYSRVWVYVSRTFDLKKISNSIVSQVSEEQSQMTEKQMIQERLGKVLAGKKILIVLDDLWEKDQSKLDELRSMLKVGEGGKVVVIITTREEEIAKKNCTVEPCKIEPLTDDMCWTIIKHKSTFDSRPDQEQLEQIGREIAKKCGGLALAAQSIGYILQNRTSDGWESVKNSKIWDVFALQDESSPNHVPASLMLSYSSMPPNLKLCFAYCAIFPKGHNIGKDDLIHQWISLGFIEPAEIFSTRQLGEKYVSHLLGMSFLQHSKSPLSDEMLYEDVTLFTMHDLVHDLARSVMADEVLDASKKGNSCRYALLTDCSKPLTSPAKIRALCFLDCSEIELLDAALSSAKHVRVLDLSGCKIRKLPCSIAGLKQLRYLNAPRILEESFPECITKLSKLNYLNLRGSRGISTLPESIGEMEGLMHLDLSGCESIEKLPKSFVKLKEMVYLDLSYCLRVKDIPEALGGLTKLQYLNLSNSGVKSFPECITKLSKLNYLNLRGSRGISTLPESIGEMEGLMHLDLSGCESIEKLPKSFVKLKEMVYLDLSYCLRVKDIPEALGGLTKLQYLNLSNIGFEARLRGLPEVIVSLTKLRYLNLSWCMDFIFGSSSQQCDSFIDSISTLSNLEHLDLSYSRYLVSIPEIIGSLKKLRTLDLSVCTGLERLPESMANMDSLKALHVKGCGRLDPSTLSRFTHFALLPHFVVQAGDGDSTSNLVLLQHANPDKLLKISGLENVKAAQEVQSIKLKEKQRIEELEFEWTRDPERSVEDMEVLGELVPPSTLGRFKIQGYNSVSFPAWLMDIRHFLPNLNEIKMEDLPNCKCLPPLGQLPNLRKLLLADMHGITKIDEGFYGGEGAFPQLREFELRGMKSLEEWNTTYSSGEQGSNKLMFPKLQTLRIIDLPNCKCLPPLGQLPNLHELLLVDMHGITKIDEGFYGGARAFPQLQGFELHGMKSLEEWNTTYSSGEEGSSELMFPKLWWLTVNNCPMLRMKPHPPRAVRHWSIERSDTMISSWGETVSHTRASSSSDTVTYLEVRCCEVPLHRWRLLHHLPTLRGLTISNCSDLTGSPEIVRHLSSLKLLFLEDQDQAELPKWLGELTSLQWLRIANYPDLKDLQGNMRQLTSLQELELSKCRSMASLPPWLGELTSLQKLYIKECTGIKSLPDSIQQLTNLEYLSILDCPELKQWCESEENKKKLAHINQKDFYI